MVEIIKKDNNIIFKIKNNIDLYIEPKIKKEISKYLDKDYDIFTIDLANVKYIDSCGLGMFVYLAKLIETKNKKLIIQSVPNEVMKVFKVGRFDKLLNII